MDGAERVLAWLAAAVEREQLDAHGVHVLLGDGQAQRRWYDDIQENVDSVSKGVSALAAGIAADEASCTSTRPSRSCCRTSPPAAAASRCNCGTC